MIILKYTFLLGAVGYPVLELIYRRKTHYSMALAGGLSTMLLRYISQLPCGIGTKGILGGIGITGIEYACGQIWNRNYQVWDYRHIPLNLHGQICLPYTLIWCTLSAGLLTVLGQIDT